MFAWSQPMDLKTLKLLSVAIINRCTNKHFSEMATHMWSEVVTPKKTFFLWRLLCLNQGTVFLYFMKVVVAIQSLMDTVFTLEEHLQPGIAYIQSVWQIFPFKIYCNF